MKKMISWDTPPKKVCKKEFRHLTGIMLALTFLLNLTVSANSYSQINKISLNMNNVSLEKILGELREQTGLRFFYSLDKIKKVQNVSLNAMNEEISQIMDKLLKNTSLTYTLMDDIIVIKDKDKQKSTGSINIPAIENLKGQVKDRTGDPLPGVTVRIKGSTIGTVTNADGQFELKILSESPIVLQFSFIGMKSKEITANDNKFISVVLDEDKIEIDEVVVTGFFDRKKEGFAGSVTTIQKADLQKLSTGNIFTTISMLDAGFKINEDNLNGSNPNKIPDFTIRGKGSFQNGSTSPLFILDGFEVSAEKIFDMDPNRIESLTLLKDASATILYGSRASNGVIVIETSKPQPGLLRVTYDFKPTIAHTDLSGYDLMDAREKLEYEQLAGLFDKGSKLNEKYEAEAEYYKRYRSVAEGVNTYWLSQPIEVAFSHAHSLYVEGGVDNVRYGIDANYNQQNGVMKSSGRDRMGLGFSLIYRIKDKITIKNYISYAHSNGHNSPYGSFSTYGLLNPYERTRDENGEILPLLSNGEPNPLFDASLPFRSFDESQEFREQLNIDWMLNQQFRLRGQVGIGKTNGSSENYTSPFSSRYILANNTTTNIEERGELSSSNDNALQLSGNITLNYNKLFAEKHLLYVGIGSEVTTSNSSSEGYIVTGFPDDRFSEPAFAIQYKKNTKASSSESSSRSVGFFGNLNYIYNNRFFADASIRYDGSSQFGADNKFASFWSLGTGWNIHNEKFWSKTSLIDLFKIRYSYGITGNQEFSAYQAKTMFTFNTERLYNTLIPVTLMGYGNPDLKWQNQYQSNIGLDFGLAKSRFRFTFNYYNKRTEGMLTSISVAPSLGFPSNHYTANLGKIKNTGYEININSVIIRKAEKDLEWAIYLQGAHNKNTLVEISNQLKGINDRNNLSAKTPGAVYEEGQSMSAIKAVKSLGIDPVTGQEIYVKKDGTLTYHWDASDKILCGDTEPKFYGNLGSNLFWKGWNMNIVFKYNFGSDNYNQTLADRVEGANPASNADRQVLNDRWVKPGDHALYKNIKNYTNTYISTRFVQKENTVQLTSLSLSYNFGKEWLRKFKLNTLRLSFYANDLMRFSTIQEERGLSYPFQRSYVFGLNVSF